MVNKKSKDFIQNQIMSESRHQFIYSYDTKEKDELLKELSDKYPVIRDQNMPSAIYIEDFGLPKIEAKVKPDNSKIDIISSEYLSLSIASSILEASQKTISKEILEEKAKRLINLLNKYNRNPNYPQINNIDDLIKIMNQSKDFYRTFYESYLEEGKELNIMDSSLSFFHLDMFVREYKEALKNDSYFGIILNKKSPIALSSTKAVNFFVGARINKDIAMKIVTTPESWDSYIDQNGQYIEAVHDYGIIELDGSYDDYSKKLRK